MQTIILGKQPSSTQKLLFPVRTDLSQFHATPDQPSLRLSCASASTAMPEASRLAGKLNGCLSTRPQTP